MKVVNFTAAYAEAVLVTSHRCGWTADDRVEMDPATDSACPPSPRRDTVHGAWRERHRLTFDVNLYECSPVQYEFRATPAV